MEFFQQRIWEVGQESHQIVDVQGRSRYSLEFWEKNLQASIPVIECIKEGYKLPLISMPDSFCRGNHKSAHMHSMFVTEAISELIRNRCVRKVDVKLYICSPL